MIFSGLTLLYQCLRPIDTKFFEIFYAHPIEPESVKMSHFLECDASGSRNFGVLRPRKMILTILEPVFDDGSNDVSHYRKNFAQWATGGKMGF